jgi:acylphosphatase
MKREIVTVMGRVQGVGYRDTVAEIAEGYAVAGAVRNLRSGALEIDVEGEEGAVDAFVAAFLAERPPLARIDNVGRRRTEPLGISGFSRAPSE